MIKHTVLLDFKSEFTADEINHMLNHMRELTHSISEIKSFSCGAHCSPENLNRGFTHGFTMTFENKKDRDTYLHHDNHKEVAKQIIIPALKDGINSALVFDYEY